MNVWSIKKKDLKRLFLCNFPPPHILIDGHLNPKLNLTPLLHAIIIWKREEEFLNDVISSGDEPDSQLRCCLCQENKLSPSVSALCVHREALNCLPPLSGHFVPLLLSLLDLIGQFRMCARPRLIISWHLCTAARPVDQEVPVCFYVLLCKLGA